MIGLDGEAAFSRLAVQLDQPKQFLQALRALFAYAQREVFGEVEIHKPRYRVLAWFSGPVRTRAGTSLGRLFFFRDATREKQADQMKNEFITIVSHELRTPLTSIKGFTELILEGDAGEISPAVQEFLEIVKSSADQLVGITNDILETARIELGKIKLELKPLAPARIIRHAVDAIRPLLNSKQQVITVDLPTDLPLIYADQERLAQILTNLLSNAHKYTPERGSITLRAYAAERLDDYLEQRVDGPSVVIDVIDTGIGIAPEDQVHLFTRFYRVSNAETHGIGGTGLGLNVTRSLVQMHGGSIWVDSAHGRGSTFSFSLPAVIQPDQASSRPGPPPDDRPLILVIEPDAAVGRLIRHHLERAGHYVSTVIHVEEAINLAREHRPALVTVDEFAGVEQLRAEPAMATTPMIMISTAEDAERASMLGIVAYLPKPIDERCLVDVVNATLAAS